MPVRYQKMINRKDQSSLTPGMGYVNLISDDWKTTSHGSHCKQSLSTDGGDIKIILSNQESGVETEKIVIELHPTQNCLYDYVGEYGESLRSLRFSYNGSTLFLSSLGWTENCQWYWHARFWCHLHLRQQLDSRSRGLHPTRQPFMSKKKKCKSFAKRAHQAREKPKSRPIISIPQNNKDKELQVAHSISLYKVHEEAEPKFKSIRQKLNNLALDRQEPKNRRASTKPEQAVEGSFISNPNTSDLGGEAGKTAYQINVGRVENLYISSKRNSSLRSSTSSTRSSIIDLHGCNRNEAIERLDSSFSDWMDTAMQGEYPWVIPAVIVCGGGNQILSETVETWIKGNKNVANAPRGHFLSQ